MGKVYEPWPPGLDKADFGVKRFTRIGRRRRRSWISALMRIHDEDDGLFTAAINSGRERISPTRVSTHTHTHVHHACTVTDAIRWDDYRFCSTRCLSCRYARAKSSKKTGFVLPFCRAVRPRHLFSIKLEHFVDWIPPWRRSNLGILWILPSGSLCIFLIRFIFLCVCVYIYIFAVRLRFILTRLKFLETLLKILAISKFYSFCLAQKEMLFRESNKSFRCDLSFFYVFSTRRNWNWCQSKIISNSFNLKHFFFNKILEILLEKITNFKFENIDSYNVFKITSESFNLWFDKF